MQRTTLPTLTVHPHFIGSWIIEPPSLCDSIIANFESKQDAHAQGKTTKGIELGAKDSTDLFVEPKDLLLPENKIFETYMEALFACFQDYKAQWPFLDAITEEVHVGSFNIQRYRQGQHFQSIHTERTYTSLHRLFAWMTYLNDVDVDDGGATTFHHYGLDVQPQKGLTLIWPGEWTHAHKGGQLLANQKYIMTGWFHWPTHSDD